MPPPYNRRYIMDWIATIGAIILGFLFPAELIEALKATDEKKVQDARGKACACFGFLVVFLVLLINA